LNGFFRRNRGSDLERELRRNRPQPRDEFLQMLSDRIEGEPRRAPRRTTGARLAVVGVATAVLLAALSAFGGIGYAAAAVTSVAGTFRTVVFTPLESSNKSEGDKKSEGHKRDEGDKKDEKGGKADDDQYGHKKKICHNPGPHQQTIEVSNDAVAVHLAHGDYLGKCKQS